MAKSIQRDRAIRRFSRLGLPPLQAIQTAGKLMRGSTIIIVRNRINNKPMLVLTIGKKPIK